jgi:hypothetical protein
MQPVDKFHTDLDQAMRRAEGSGPAALASLRAFFDRQFPAVRGETANALFADFAQKRRADPEAAAAWLQAVGSIILMDYDGSPLSAEDWAGLREAFAAGSDELDLDLLTYAMSLVLEHGAL